jgi:hypothetical protein
MLTGLTGYRGQVPPAPFIRAGAGGAESESRRGPAAIFSGGGDLLGAGKTGRSGGEDALT